MSDDTFIPSALLTCISCDIKGVEFGQDQLSLVIKRRTRDIAALTAAIDGFMADCLAADLCADIQFKGLLNWNADEEGDLRSQLYFSIFSSDPDGRGEKGNGIGASGSAAYARIWTIYVSSCLQAAASESLPLKITV